MGFITSLQSGGAKAMGKPLSSPSFSCGRASQGLDRAIGMKLVIVTRDLMATAISQETQIALGLDLCEASV